MESGSQIIEIWQVFKEYIDKKNIETVAERFVDVCADFGTSDESFREALGAMVFLPTKTISAGIMLSKES